MTTLLTLHEYGSSSLNGNCGGRTAYRLLGAYQSDSQTKAVRKQLRRKRRLSAIDAGLGSEPRLANYLMALRAANEANRNAFSYPIEWAFADVLESFGPAYAVVCLSDTHDGAGDGHKGAFATRHFADWLLENNLMHGERVEGMRGKGSLRRTVYMWALVPDLAAISTYLVSARSDVRGFIAEMNRQANYVPKKQPEPATDRMLREQWIEDILLGDAPDEPPPPYDIRQTLDRAQAAEAGRTEYFHIATTAEEEENDEQEENRERG